MNYSTYPRLVFHSFGKIRLAVISLSILFLFAVNSYSQNQYQLKKVIGNLDGYLDRPSGVAIDPTNGNIIISSMRNNTIQIFTSSGEFVKQFGGFGNTAGTFNIPNGVAINSTGNIYVMDQSNNRLQVFSKSGEFLWQTGSPGSANGKFSTPTSIAVDGNDHIYIADNGNSRIQILDNTGSFIRKFGSYGQGDGQFNGLQAIALDNNGNIYASDYGRVQVFDVNGNFLFKFGTVGDGDGQFKTPSGITINNVNRNIYVADQSNNRIEIFTSEGIYLSQFGLYGAADGEMSYPQSIKFDLSGNLVIVDSGNNRVQIASNTGVFISKIGTNGKADGQFREQIGRVGLDSKGYTYVPDPGNYRVQVFNQSGAFVRKFGLDGKDDDQYWSPFYLAVDAEDNIYVADFYNNRVQVYSNEGVFIRSINDGIELPFAITFDKAGKVYVLDFNFVNVYSKTGELLKQVGMGSQGSAEGQFNNARGLVVDEAGYIYVVDTNNHRVQVFNSEGVFQYKFGTNGTGNGQFIYPTSIAEDGIGNLYITDLNSKVQVFNHSGMFIRKFGSEGKANGQFEGPYGIVLDKNGNIYISDTGNYRVQIFSKAANAITNFTDVSKIFGDPDFTLNASSQSLGAISYSVVSDPSNTGAVVIDGNTIEIIQAGKVKIRATATDDLDFAGVSKEITIDIAKANQSVSLENISDKKYGDTFELIASSSVNLGLIFTSNSSTLIIEDNKVTAVGEGTITITATQQGNANYQTASAAQTFNILNSKAALSTPLLAFDDLLRGESASKSFVISNEGNTDLNINNIQYPESFIGDKTQATITPGANVSVDVTFAPLLPNDYSGDIELTISKSISSPDGKIKVPITGRGMTITAIELPFEEFANVYPNPVYDVIEIHSSKVTPGAKAIIIDATGHVAMTTILEERGQNIYPINMSELMQGIYFLKINLDDKIITKRIIKN
jgi:tripartite motif-containing protein 71